MAHKKLTIEQLLDAIEQTKGNKQAAIDMLGISFPTWQRYELSSKDLQEKVKSIIFTNRDDRMQKRTQQRKNTKLNVNFSITVEEYNALHAKQGGVCAICKKPETRRHWSGKISSLAVDHDHETGRIRGLLCNKCNIAIGLMSDDTQKLSAAIDYLEKH